MTASDFQGHISRLSERTIGKTAKPSRPVSGGRGPALYVRMMVPATGVAVSLLFNWAGAAPKRFELQDVSQIVQVSDVQLSPDGKSVVCLVSRPNIEEATYERSLVLVDIESGAERELTFNRKGVASPRWSPSGDRIAFLAEAPISGSIAVGKYLLDPKVLRLQVFVLPMNGGDPRPITDGASDVDQFSWSPNGLEIAYTAEDVNPNEREIAAHRDAFEVGDNDYLATRAQMSTHLWVVSVDGGVARRVTAGAWSLPRSTPPNSPASPLSWSRDGTSIAIVRRQTALRGDQDRSEVATVNIVTGQIRALTTHGLHENSPTYSPDGTRISYLYPRDGDPNSEHELFVTTSSGGNSTDVTHALDRDVVGAVWMPHGEGFLVVAPDETRIALWSQSMDGSPKKMALGSVEPAWRHGVDVSVGGDGALVFSGETTERPVEVYYSASLGTSPRRITNFNHVVAARHYGHSETFSWVGPNGFKEDGVVIYPPDFDPTHRYPLVLIIHGGPQAASTLSFDVLGQLLAAREYIVFQPNYRGSDNLGNAYERAIVNDAGDGPGRDVITGMEALLRGGFIDSSRIAISGWSWGGYMTSWLTAHYQIWRAAVAGAAVNDLVHAYNLSDFNVTQRYSMNGSPWSGSLIKAYRDQSPITYAARIRTPTLILSNTGDARVPITQSYFMYHALKDNGVEVKFIAYPISGHFAEDPVRVTDLYRRWIEWIDEHIK